MTREEREKAIQELKDGRDGYSEYISNETFNRAIEALKREPSTDAISRSHALSEFKRIYFDNPTVIRCAELVLNGESPVAPERPKGEWAYIHEGVSTYKVVCSKCGYVLYLSEGGFASMNDFKSYLNHLQKNRKFDNFCPNCGADMRE